MRNDLLISGMNARAIQDQNQILKKKILMHRIELPR